MVSRHMIVKTGFGQDSHRFERKDSSKRCVVGGVYFEEVPGFKANSDGDVAYHAVCNAISSLTGVLVLGGIADDLCLKDGITNSEVYLKEALKTLHKIDYKISHVALSLEGKRPLFKNHLVQMRQNIATLLEIELTDVGVTATSGEGLSDYGCGDGVFCQSIVTVYKEEA